MRFLFNKITMFLTELKSFNEMITALKNDIYNAQNTDGCG